MCVPRTQPAARTFLSPSKPLHPRISMPQRARDANAGNWPELRLGCEALYRLWLLIARSMARFASRSAVAARLSYSFLPLHRPSSTFTMLPLKYRDRGTSVYPSTLICWASRRISLRCINSRRGRKGSLLKMLPFS